MRIAYLTQYDAKNILSWSGSGFNIAQCLERSGANLDYVGPLKNKISVSNAMKYLVNAKMLHKRDHPQRDPGFLRSYGEQATALLDGSKADIVFAPGGLPLSYLRTNVPTVLWTDCTFANMVDYYPTFSGLSDRTLRNGHAGERLALHNCDLLFFTSDWAAQSAIKDYGVDPAKVEVVPFGSNMAAELSPLDVDGLIAERQISAQKCLKLFCSGVDWYRKGIDIAVLVVEELTRRGIVCELTVAGCAPPPGAQLPDYVKVVGFVSKHDPAGLQALTDYYRSSHLLLVPTRAECYGLVFCEAASFALPSVTTETGGTRSAMGEGQCGVLLAKDASVTDWADAILASVAKADVYETACRSAYAAYKERLNWTASGKTIMALLADLIEKH